MALSANARNESAPRGGRAASAPLRTENGRAKVPNGRARDDKRGKILKSAVKVFARKGFYNAKISEIAHHAGVADGTIYLYFKNKDDILICLFEENMGKIIDKFQAKLTTSGAPSEKLRMFVHQHFELVRTMPDLAAVMQLELRQSNKFIKEYSGSRFSDYLNLISRIIHDGQHAGVFRGDLLPGIIKRALFGALDEFSTLWVLSKDKRYDLHDAAEQISNLFLEGLCVSKAPRAEGRGQRERVKPAAARK
ncbi:MAG: TetR/AcrR family transcriptional regulator [bacterium]